MLLDLYSLWTGPAAQPAPPVVVTESGPVTAGSYWVGGRRLRKGPAADEEVLEYLLLRRRGKSQ